MNITKYYEKQKLDRAPGAKSGTLAKDMGSQGPVLDHGAPFMNLTKQLRNPGPGNIGSPAPTTLLRRLMKQ